MDIQRKGSMAEVNVSFEIGSRDEWWGPRNFGGLAPNATNKGPVVDNLTPQKLEIEGFNMPSWAEVPEHPGSGAKHWIGSLVSTDDERETGPFNTEGTYVRIFLDRGGPSISIINSEVIISNFGRPGVTSRFLSGKKYYFRFTYPVKI